MYDDSDDGLQVPEMRQQMDGQGNGQAQAVPELSPGEVGQPIKMDRSKRREEGCIYFIETADKGFVKIGYSINVPQRFDQIRILLPGLRLIGHMPGTMATERWLHKKFEAHRERGEWFRHTEEVRGFIAHLGLIEPEKAKPPEGNAKGKKNVAAVALGSLGGKARRGNLTKEQRSTIARAVDPETSAAAAAMGRKGGPARARSLTAKRRKEIASGAAKKRWGEKKKA